MLGVDAMNCVIVHGLDSFPYELGLSDQDIMLTTILYHSSLQIVVAAGHQRWVLLSQILPFPSVCTLYCTSVQVILSFSALFSLLYLLLLFSAVPKAGWDGMK